MSITGALVLFASLFFLVLFLLLPLGHRSQEEAGEVVPGTPAGAPERPMMGRKMIASVVISVLLVALIWWVLQQGWITRAGLMEFNRPNPSAARVPRAPAGGTDAYRPPPPAPG